MTCLPLRSTDTVFGRSKETGLSHHTIKLGKSFLITEDNVDEYITKMGDNIRKRADGHGVILGLSGGVDSAVVARLVQEAGVDLKCLMLPDGSAGKKASSYGDAINMAERFGIDYQVIDIEQMVKSDKMEARGSMEKATPENRRLATINVPPRVRAKQLRFIGQLESRRVIGTDNLAEQVTGYFTKGGDGDYDFCPLTNCTKGEVYILARALDVPEEIINKPPSAGLEEGQTDEAELGFTYAQIDNWILTDPHFSMQKDIDAKIKARYDATAHKRCMPYAFDVYDTPCIDVDLAR
jgi:NAD+ synthase